MVQVTIEQATSDDRLLIAPSMTDALHLVSADRAFDAYPITLIQ